MNKYISTSSIIIIGVTFWLVGCSTPANVAYFQNAEAIRGMTLQNEPKAVQRWDSCIFTAAEEKRF